MFKTDLKIDGMMCSMCEAHINDTLRSVIPLKKIKSSHKKGETIIISEAIPDENDVKKALDGIGYKMLSIKTEPYEKKGLFGF